MNYLADETRYDRKIYRRCGESGIQLPAISLGLWHNFGHIDDYQNSRSIALRAFDLGITHFDLANNYGPPPGSAEENFGRMMREDLRKYRDEMIISTKAGYLMWPGPYGDGGSRKYLIASLDQSLKRMGLDYVDIFYHHRPDSTTPIDETLSTLSHIVRSGKALYIGLSNYTPDLTRQAAIMLKKMGTPCLIHQPRYNMLDRWAENGLLQVLENERIGCIAYSPLAQGLLTNRYQNGIPADSRASKPHGFLKEDRVEETLPIIRKLEEIAQSRGQSLAQMALVWILRDPVVSSVLIGASSVGQLEDSFNALNNKNFRSDELERIDKILKAKYK